MPDGLGFRAWTTTQIGREADGGHCQESFRPNQSRAGVRRTKGEHDIPPFVGTRKTCTVSFQDSGGVRHAVEVGAETLYEAAVLALKAFREHDCVPGPAASLDIDVKSPSVRHTVMTRKVEEWLTGGARSPNEALEKRRLKELLG